MLTGKLKTLLTNQLIEDISRNVTATIIRVYIVVAESELNWRLVLTGHRGRCCPHSTEQNVCTEYKQITIDYQREISMSIK